MRCDYLNHMLVFRPFNSYARRLLYSHNWIEVFRLDHGITISHRDHHHLAPSQVAAPSQVSAPSQVVAASQVVAPSQAVAPSQIRIARFSAFGLEVRGVGDIKRAAWTNTNLNLKCHTYYEAITSVELRGVSLSSSELLHQWNHSCCYKRLFCRRNSWPAIRTYHVHIHLSHH